MPTKVDKMASARGGEYRRANGDCSPACNADLFGRSAVLPPITTKSRGLTKEVRATLLIGPPDFPDSQGKRRMPWRLSAIRWQKPLRSGTPT